MYSKSYIPLEQRSREEADKLKRTWSSGPFNFLLSRTREKYHLKAIVQRRLQIESQLNILLPKITDNMLKALYDFACLKYQNKCRLSYGESSGFLKTPSERAFERTLKVIIQNNPVLKHLEVYPSEEFSRDWPIGFKMAVGNYVPDFLIFGLKIKKFSAVAIEIDGDSHIERHEKDSVRNSHLKNLKIFTFEVQNSQVTDINFLTKALLKMYKLRNGSFNQQILRAKRSIWVKTITCQLSLVEIEEFLIQRFSTHANLCKESEAQLRLNDCPRKIKAELIKARFS